jgi:glycosyltransferase involved in cell wall biosynthesis
MPPVRTGIAIDSAELVGALRAEHEIDVYVHADASAFEKGKAGQPPPLDRRATSAHDFVAAQRLRPYDLTIYQLGNSSHHDYEWPYLFRYPGLAVLHDAQLHHARAAVLLRTGRSADYRVEFTANHPGVNADLAELAVAGFDTHLYYAWPMTRLAVSASRLTLVHTPALAESLRQDVSGAAVESVRLGHGVAVDEARRARARARVRAAFGITPDAIVFSVSGGLSPEKRVPQILAAFKAVLPYCPDARLLLAGAAASHYDLRADIGAHDLHAHVSVAGYVDGDDELTDIIAAGDVALNLRWPTAREMSGPWLRGLAAGVPTITIHLWHTAHVPSIDPRTWHPHGGPGAEPPVTVAIDILDEDHSLRLAMRRLASDAQLRRTIGEAGRRYWEREHAPGRMLEDYRRMIPKAAALPAPNVDLPGHLVASGDRVLRQVIAPFGLNERIWSKL